MVGTSQGMIGFILIGRKQPSLALAADIARVLGCTVDDLIIHDDICESANEEAV